VPETTAPAATRPSTWPLVLGAGLALAGLAAALFLALR
jgi:hypothetical protein